MPQTKARVYVSHQFEGYHRWANAPQEAAFLRDWHRHKFHVKLYVNVTHSDRDVEFFILQRLVKQYCDGHFEGRQFELSCEMIAEMVIDNFDTLGFDVHSCEVSEDGENGAIVEVAGIAEEIAARLEAREEYEREQQEYE